MVATTRLRVHSHFYRWYKAPPQTPLLLIKTAFLRSSLYKCLLHTLLTLWLLSDFYLYEVSIKKTWDALLINTSSKTVILRGLLKLLFQMLQFLLLLISRSNICPYISEKQPLRFAVASFYHFKRDKWLNRCQTHEIENAIFKVYRWRIRLCFDLFFKTYPIELWILRHGNCLYPARKINKRKRKKKLYHSHKYLWHWQCNGASFLYKL